MFGLLLALLIVDGLLLSVIVLLQAGKGDGLAAMGASGGTIADGILGGRQAATLLTKATWTTGALFLVLALVLSVMSSRAANPQSVLQDSFTPTQPQPVLPQDAQGVLPPPTGGDAGQTTTTTGQGTAGQTTTTNQ